jgi:peptidoglycan-associated lipoprotein
MKTQLLIGSILAITMLMLGCAKKPVTVVSSAPAPTGGSSSTRMTGDLREILFDFDKYAIRPRDAQVLDGNARSLRANPGELLLIEGHCDERGTAEYNLALGDRRAKAAMDYLVAQGSAGRRIAAPSFS